MSDYPHRVQIERVCWLDTFPGLRLVGTLRQSLVPGRMFLALLLVVLVYLGGQALDFVWGDRVHPGELSRYMQLDREGYRRYLTEQKKYQQNLTSSTGVGTRRPIFQTLVEQEMTHFNGMVNEAVGLRFGVIESLTGRPSGVLGQVQAMLLTIPGWMLTTHPGFSAVFLIYGFALTMVLGGAITRLAALEACGGVRISPFAALRFSLHKAGWFIAAPLLPVALVGGIAVVLAGAGLVLFNLPVLDIVGGLLFGLLLLLGCLAAAILLGLGFCANLLTPALAVEDGDAFDAVSRSYSYVLAHPWRYAAYLAGTVVYGAVGYLLVGLLLFLTLWVTRTFTGLLVYAEVGEGAQAVNRLHAILPDPRLGAINDLAAGQNLGGSVGVAAMMVSIWVKLLLAVLPAYCVSFHCTAMTWVYLLLRQATDGAAMNEIAMPDATPPAAPDLIDPPDPATPSA